MKLLSFIIPSYNCEKYLEKCLRSMLHPELLELLDIIVVNDGSKDSTQVIAQQFANDYPNTVRLINQENKGHGGALNTGCAAAVGKYLKIIDADDWVETDNLPAFLRLLESCNSDVVLTHHYTRDISNGEIKQWKSYPKQFEAAYTLEQIMEAPGNFDRSLTFHGITYRTDFYQSKGLQLSEKVFYEDHEFATFPCCFAQSVTPVDLFIYHYRIGDVEQSVSQANQLKRLSHMETVLNRLVLEYNALSLSDGGRAYFEMKAQVVLLSYMTTVLLVEPDKKKGRKLAETMIERFRTQLVGAYNRSINQYRIFCLMNRLHISKTAWDKLLDSRLYRRIRGSHEFN